MQTTFAEITSAYIRLARALLGRAGAFTRCSPQTLDDLVAHSTFERIKMGDVLSRRGDPFTRLTFVIEGIVKIGVSHSPGHRHLDSYITVGDFSGLLSCFDGLPFSHDVFAHTEVLVMHIPSHVLHRAQSSDPFLFPALSVQLATRARRLYDKLIDASLFPPQTRLARLLLELARVFGRDRDGSIQISERVPQHDIADLLGTSRQWTNKELNALTCKRIIRMSRRNIEILDEPKLNEIARI